MIAVTKIRELLEKTLDLANEALSKGNYPIGALFTDQEGTIVALAQTNVRHQAM